MFPVRRDTGSKAAALFFCCVWSVVSCNYVDCAVCQTFYKGVAVFRCADGRVHLKAALVQDIILAKSQVVGCGLAGNVDAAGLGVTN